MFAWVLVLWLETLDLQLNPVVCPGDVVANAGPGGSLPRQVFGIGSHARQVVPEQHRRANWAASPPSLLCQPYRLSWAPVGAPCLLTACSVFLVLALL